MKMALDDPSGVNAIKSYETGRVQIREHYYTSSLIVLPNELLTGWEAHSADQLCAAHLEPILARRPEVLILGTGDAQVFPDPAIFMSLMDLGVGFEVMDNAAACRTYNVLLAEDRRAALALMLAGDTDR